MEGKKRYKKFAYIFTIIIIACIAKYMGNIGGFLDNGAEQSNTAIEKAIQKSALECYALEGSFPPNIEYLAKNYGLIVNNDAYFYHYQPNGSNIMPDIKVMKRW